jgi:hypothetical protein
MTAGCSLQYRDYNNLPIYFNALRPLVHMCRIIYFKKYLQISEKFFSLRIM